MSSAELFGPNSHSQYKVGWVEIDNSVKDEVTAVLLNCYLFSNVSLASIKEVDAWEVISKNYRAQVIDESGDRRDVVLHKFLRLKDPQTIRISGEIITFLHREGIKVPEIVRTEGKTDSFTQYQENCYRVFEFVEGDHFRGTKSELKDFAGNLAAFHKTLEHAPYQSELALRPAVSAAWDIEGWRELFGRARSGESPIAGLVLSSKDLILEQAQFISQGLCQPFNFRTQIIRGDLHPHDTIYQKGKLRALVDFDDMRVGELMRDVTTACHRFVRQFIVYQGRDWEETLALGLDLFVNEYLKVNLISDAEISAGAIFIADELLRKIYRDLNKYYLAGQTQYLSGGELEKRLTLLQESKIISQYLR